MAQHYYDKTDTHYLSQARLTIATTYISEIHLELLERYLNQCRFETATQKQEVLKNLKHFQNKLSKFLKIKHGRSNLLKIFEVLDPNLPPSVEAPNFFSGIYYSHTDKLKKEGHQYGLFGGNDRQDSSGIRALSKKPVEEITDGLKSTKIYWAEHKEQQEFFAFVAPFLSSLEQLIKEQPYVESFTLSQAEDMRKKAPPIDSVVHASQLIKVVQDFWQDIEKKIIPALKETYELKEENYVYREFTGSLDNIDAYSPEALAAQNPHYLIGSGPGGLEGFVGLVYVYREGYQFGIVKEIKNAHIFCQDMTQALSIYAPLSKINLHMSIANVNPINSPQAQKVAAYLDKRNLEKSLAPSDTTGTAEPTVKKSKI